MKGWVRIRTRTASWYIALAFAFVNDRSSERRSFGGGFVLASKANVGKGENKRTLCQYWPPRSKWDCSGLH